MKKLFMLLLPFAALGQTPQDDFVLIAAGKPSDSLTSAFYLATAEVTYGQMQAFCQANHLDPLQFHSSSSGSPKANRAAVNVTWYDAVRYCNWLSQQAGLEPAYVICVENDRPLDIKKDSAAYWAKDAKDTWVSITYRPELKGYRLPRSFEWEIAASGYNVLGTRQRYAGTDDVESLHLYAHYNANDATIGYEDEERINCAQEVKTLKPNINGLFDMAGNVWEWCDNPYVFGISPYIKIDLIPFQGLKGGAWADKEDYCRISYDNDEHPDYEQHTYGFRVAITQFDARNW